MRESVFTADVPRADDDDDDDDDDGDDVVVLSCRESGPLTAERITAVGVGYYVGYTVRTTDSRPRVGTTKTCAWTFRTMRSSDRRNTFFRCGIGAQLIVSLEALLSTEL